jgi:twinkle protein
MGHVSAVPEGLLIGSDFATYMRETELPAQVVPAANYREALKRAMFGKATPKPKLPWAKTADLFEYREGEVTLYAGANGSGKSMLMSHCSLGLMRQGEKVAIASFEMKPIKQLERMARQVSMGGAPSEHAIDMMCDWLTGKLWFYDQQGTVRPETVYRLCGYVAERLKCRHVVIDSLMKCVRGEDDFNAQKEFVDELTSVARDTGVHIHLVHHVRKPDDQNRVPTKFDAKGSGSITDQVDNVFMVWRNKAKEAVEERALRGEVIPAKDEDLLDAPDVLMACEKQRNGDWEGRIALWFHKASLQYCPDKRRMPQEIIR